MFFNVSSVDANGLAIFSISASDLFSNYVQQFELNSGSASTVIINVSGTNISWSTGNMIGEFVTDGGEQKVIWNFYEAQNIILNNNIHGAILAPYADTVANNVPIDGSVVVNSLTTTGEVHLPTFNGNISNTVCNPISTPTATLVPTNTPTFTPTATLVPTNTPTFTPTATLVPTNTPTFTPTATLVPQYATPIRQPSHPRPL